MSDQLDRPARPARRPRPAADADVDPIDYRGAAPTAAPAPTIAKAPVRVAPGAAVEPSGGVERPAALTPPPASGPAARDVTVQLNSRIAVDVAAVFDAGSTRFPSKRAALEHAILTAFGSKVDGEQESQR